MIDPTDDSIELNLDGLVGPTHSYAGLSFGNLASQRSSSNPSLSRVAARRDASVMPAILRAHTQAATLMIAERGAQRIRSPLR